MGYLWPSELGHLCHMGPGTGVSTLVTAHQSLTGRVSGNTPLKKSLTRGQGSPTLTLEHPDPRPGDPDPFQSLPWPSFTQITVTLGRTRKEEFGAAQYDPIDIKPHLSTPHKLCFQWSVAMAWSPVLVWVHSFAHTGVSACSSGLLVINLWTNIGTHSRPNWRTLKKLWQINAQLGTNIISLFIKLPRPPKCVIFNVRYLYQYLRFWFEM